MEMKASGRASIAGELPAEFNSELYRAAVLKRFEKLNLEMVDSTGAYSSVRLWTVFVPQSARECHQYSPRLLEILGDPGSRKSSLIRYLALRWSSIADRATWEAQPIPPVIDLGRYGQWKCEGQKGFVRFLEEAPVWHEWPRRLFGAAARTTRSGRAAAGWTGRNF